MEKTALRLLLPGLKPFYDCVEPLSWALIRITAGLMIGRELQADAAPRRRGALL